MKLINYLFIALIISSFSFIKAMEQESTFPLKPTEESLVELTDPQARLEQIAHAIAALNKQIIRLLEDIIKAANQGETYLFAAPKFYKTLNPEKQQEFKDQALEIYNSNEALWKDFQQNSLVNGQPSLYNYALRYYQSNKDTLNLLLGATDE